MSTRANIVIADANDELWFYRHSDGYPQCCGESLKRFLRWVIDGKIRDNVGQASGWLILLGAVEYQTLAPQMFPEGAKPIYEQDKKAVESALASPPSGWKCGSYEPTTGKHDDIQYLYFIDLAAKEIRCCTPDKKLFYAVTAGNIDLPITEPK